MKAVLMSMKPEWWEKIKSGEKTLEIRKNHPTAGAGETGLWPLLVLVYISGTGEVRGQFMCNGWVKTNFLPYLSGPSCVSLEQLEEYAGGPGKSLCGWIVTEAQEYTTPSLLAEFGLNRPPMSWQYVEVPDELEEF